MKPSHKFMGVSFWSCSKPAATIAALEAAAAAAQVLSGNHGIFAQVQPLVDLSKMAIPAGTNCKAYAAELAQQATSAQVRIPTQVRNDLYAFTTFIGEVLKTDSLFVNQEAIKANLVSAYERMTTALQTLQPVTRQPVGQGQFAARAPKARVTTPVNLFMVAATGVHPDNIRQTIAGMFAAAHHSVEAFKSRNNGFTSCEVQLAEGLTVEFRSADEIERFGTPAMLCQQFANEIAKFVPQFDQVNGASNYGTNQHQVTLRFSQAPITAIVSTSKPLNTYGSAQQFFGFVQSSFSEQASLETIPANIDDEQYPFANTPWGDPMLVGTVGVKDTAFQPA